MPFCCCLLKQALKVFQPSALLCPYRSCSGGRGQEGLGLSQQHLPLLVTGWTTAFEHSGLWGQILWEGRVFITVQFFHSKLHEKRGCRASLPAVQCALKHPYSQMCWSICKMLPSLLCSPSALTLNWLKCMCCVSDIAGMISLYNHEFVRLWLSAF